MSTEKIAILTDSCADIPPEFLQKYPIFVVPLQIIYPEGSYADGVTISAKQVYARFPHEIPHTSLPHGDDVLEILQRIVWEGYEKLLVIHFSSGLSGTYQMVKLLAQNYPGIVSAAFDTLSGSLGTGAIVLQTAEYIAQGCPWEELCRRVPRLIANTKVFFSVDTLEYLHKGGRIGKITAVTGTLLQIKPIITFAEDGQLINIAKVRGRAQAMDKLVELACAACGAGKRYNIMTAHGDAPEDGKKIRDKLRRALPGYRFHFESVIDSTLGAYVGPHLLGAGIQVLDDEL